MNGKIVGIGELLWDVFPDGRYPGGAPFNFAWHARMLGAEAAIIARLGEDPLGDELRQVLRQAGLDEQLVQHDGQHPTGTVQVALKEGQPTYTITEEVAWDYLEASPRAREVVSEAAVVCFGSLAQRNPVSAEAIAALVRAARKAKVIFDINLRQQFYTRSVLEHSLQMAQVVKLNDEELRTISALLELSESAAEELLRKYDLELVVETLGADGCRVYSPQGSFPSPGLPVKVADAVGAGDAFTAALAVGLARGEDLQTIARQANRVGAFVATQRGAIPHYTTAMLDDFAAFFNPPPAGS